MIVVINAGKWPWIWQRSEFDRLIGNWVCIQSYPLFCLHFIRTKTDKTDPSEQAQFEQFRYVAWIWWKRYISCHFSTGVIELPSIINFHTCHVHHTLNFFVYDIVFCDQFKKDKRKLKANMFLNMFILVISDSYFILLKTRFRPLPIFIRNMFIISSLLREPTRQR